MSAGEAITAYVEKIALGGEGLAVSEGKRIFIPLSAPGDVLKAIITEDHGSWARAEIKEIYESSGDRINPRCQHFGECGGCSLQHLSYETQLEIKKDILVSALKRSEESEEKSKLSDLVPPVTVVSSEPWEYRNRVSLHALRSNRFPRCGFKARKSEEIIPLKNCPVSDSGIQQVLPRILPPPGKDRFNLYSKGEVLIAEAGTTVSDDKKSGIERQIPGRGTITLSEHDPAFSFLSRKITLDAASFFQSNAGVLEKLVCQTRDIAAKITDGSSDSNLRSGVMADLYAGVGTFSLFLSDLFPGGADLVESDSRALNLAKINLSRSGDADGKHRFFDQKTEQWIRKQDCNAYSLVVADPPRQGLSPLLTQTLCQSGPSVFIYVSCDPSTFARDFHGLVRNYKLQNLFLFDFYPQTAHIETMGVFRRK